MVLASCAEHQIYIRGNEVNVPTGTVIGTCGFLAERWKWDRKAVRKYLDWLSRESMMGYTSTSVTIIISICNWDLYQQSAHSRAQQSVQPSTHTRRMVTWQRGICVRPCCCCMVRPNGQTDGNGIPNGRKVSRLVIKSVNRQSSMTGHKSRAVVQ
jgi:hypothetical protein